MYCYLNCHNCHDGHNSDDWPDQGMACGKKSATQGV